MNPVVDPEGVVHAIAELVKFVPWAAGFIAFVVLIRVCIVPLIKAWKGKQ